MKNERWLICWPIHRESYPGCTGSPQEKPAQYQVTQSAEHREPLFSAGIDQCTANDFRKGDSVFVQLLKVKKNTAIGYHPLLARFRWIFPGFYKSVCNFLILYLYFLKKTSCVKMHSDVAKTLNASTRFSVWSADRQKLPRYCGSPCTSNHA